jgi:hypothetical protein
MARVGPFVPLHAQARERLILPVYVRRAPCATILLPSDLSQLPHSRLVDGLLDEFERAAGEDIPGTGLGLAIVKELCRVLSRQS